MDKREVTIYDIAKKLNIAASTVSRGLKGHHTVSAKTQKKIAATAELMGYQSNTFAANLRRQSTNTIGVIIPRMNNYFMAEVLSGIEKVANEAGFSLIVSQSLDDSKKEKANAQHLFDVRIDGLLVSLAENSKDTAHFKQFFMKEIPVIFMDRIPSQNDFPSVAIDNIHAGLAVGRHLIENGARKIVYVTGNLDSKINRERFEGFEMALKEAGLVFDRSNLLTGDLSESAGYQAGGHAMHVKADAVFCTSDHCAVSCMSYLKQHNVRIPKDIAVVGFNNDMISRNVEPKLTTVNYPGHKMGEISAKQLLEHLSGRSDLYEMANIILKSELIVRESSTNNNS